MRRNGASLSPQIDEPVCRAHNIAQCYRDEVIDEEVCNREVGVIGRGFANRHPEFRPGERILSVVRWC